MKNYRKSATITRLYKDGSTMQKLSPEAKKKKIARNNDWTKENMDRINLAMNKTLGKLTREQAAGCGLSVNAYVIGLIKQALARAGEIQIEEDGMNASKSETITLSFSSDELYKLAEKVKCKEQNAEIGDDMTVHVLCNVKQGVVIEIVASQERSGIESDAISDT